MPRESTARWIHAHPDLTHAEKRLALYLLDRQDDGGAIRVLFTDITRDTNMRKSHVSRAIARLVGAGILDRRNLPVIEGQPRREYRFRTPDREAMSA